MGRKKSGDWITNKSTKNINKCDDFFHLWIKNPSESNCKIYTKMQKSPKKDMIGEEKCNLQQNWRKSDS